MYDIHSHILPGIDDGAKTPKETLEMGRIADKDGITHMIATPHFNFEDQHFPEKVRRAVAKQNEEFELEKINLRLYPGAEIFLRAEILEKLENNQLLTLNDSDYLLVEFPLGEVPYHVEDILYRIRLGGKIPIIAHPERYREVMDNPNLVKGWVEQGNCIQINVTSILGVSGKKVQKTAKHLLTHNMVHLVATDTHSPRHRKPALRKAIQQMRIWDNEEKVRSIVENGKRVFQNETLVGGEPVEYPYAYGIFQRMKESVTG